MSLGVGIVGLPNVGKSTLFNALSQALNAEAANYPFCTINANRALVPLSDGRLEQIAQIVKPEKVVRATVEFTDIAGLVRGASRGEGLGNRFLANIRESNAILQVVRCFNDSDIVHVEGDVDPLRDIEIIQTELILADIQTIEKRIERVGKQARIDKELRSEHIALEKLLEHMNKGQPARSFVDDTKGLERVNREIQLLTSKPVIYCANVDEEDLATATGQVQAVQAYATAHGCDCVVISAKMEAELVGLSETEQCELLTSYGLQESGLEQIARTSYHTLGLASFFTAGKTEVHAWTYQCGWLAPECAGVIHSDFQRGFIRAEVITYDDFIRHNGEAGAQAAGVMRVEGKEYLVQDGDVIHFLFNV